MGGFKHKEQIKNATIVLSIVYFSISTKNRIGFRNSTTSTASDDLTAHFEFVSPEVSLLLYFYQSKSRSNVKQSDPGTQSGAVMNDGHWNEVKKMNVNAKTFTLSPEPK